MARDLVAELKVPPFTASQVMAMVEILRDENEKGLKDPAAMIPLMFPDERAMKAAAKRGLVRYQGGGWVVTDLAFDWAKQYERSHLRVIEGGV